MQHYARELTASHLGRFARIDDAGGTTAAYGKIVRVRHREREPRTRITIVVLETEIELDFDDDGTISIDND